MTAEQSTTAEPDAVERAQRVLKLLDAAIGVALTAWFVWQLMDHDDPLGPQARIKRWWAARERERLRKRREMIEAAEWSIELALFLERWLERGADEQ